MWLYCTDIASDARMDRIQNWILSMITQMASDFHYRWYYMNMYYLVMCCTVIYSIIMHSLSKYLKTFLSLSICVLCHLNIVISVCLQKIFNKSDMNKWYRIPDKIKIKAKSLLRRTKDNPVLCFPSLSNQFLAIDYSIDRFRFCKHNELKAAHTHTYPQLHRLETNSI